MRSPFSVALLFCVAGRASGARLDENDLLSLKAQSLADESSEQIGMSKDEASLAAAALVNESVGDASMAGWQDSPGPVWCECAQGTSGVEARLQLWYQHLDTSQWIHWQAEDPQTQKPFERTVWLEPDGDSMDVDVSEWPHDTGIKAHRQLRLLFGCGERNKLMLMFHPTVTSASMKTVSLRLHPQKAGPLCNPSYAVTGVINVETRS
mmetsp:Transcript_69320/g.137003  ORF Transcript_69320/g.137003 Transcript_69320/m.137003 type:complete len:208 (-) Transcript_69320:175-798(-)